MVAAGQLYSLLHSKLLTTTDRLRMATVTGIVDCLNSDAGHKTAGTCLHAICTTGLHKYHTWYEEFPHITLFSFFLILFPFHPSCFFLSWQFYLCLSYLNTSFIILPYLTQWRNINV
jgi:hypothetical protein